MSQKPMWQDYDEYYGHLPRKDAPPTFDTVLSVDNGWWWLNVMKDGECIGKVRLERKEPWHSDSKLRSEENDYQEMRRFRIKEGGP